MTSAEREYLTLLDPLTAEEVAQEMSEYEAAERDHEMHFLFAAGDPIDLINDRWTGLDCPQDW